MMKAIAKWVSLAAIAVSLSACNTIAGLGEDLQYLGSAFTKEEKKQEKKPADTNSGVTVTPVK